MHIYSTVHVKAAAYLQRLFRQIVAASTIDYPHAVLVVLVAHLQVRLHATAVECKGGFVKDFNMKREINVELRVGGSVKAGVPCLESKVEEILEMPDRKAVLFHERRYTFCMRASKSATFILKRFSTLLAEAQISL